MIGLFDRRAVFQVIGGVLQNPTLLDEYTLTQEDFNGDSFHQIVFSSIYNLHNQGVSVIDCFALDSFISSYEKQYRIFTSNNGIEYVNEAISMCEPENFIYNYNRVKKFSLLRYYVSQNMDITAIYDMHALPAARVSILYCQETIYVQKLRKCVLLNLRQSFFNCRYRE